MFIKSVLSKFTYIGDIAPLTSIDIEALILNSDTENFCVVDKKNPYFAGAFNVNARESRYGIPTDITYTDADKKSHDTKDFVLYRNFKNDDIPMSQSIKAYGLILRAINDAIYQRSEAATLVCTIKAKNADDKKELERIFGTLGSIKIFQTKDDDSASDDITMSQFEILNNMETLTNVKKQIKKDLFECLGVTYGSEKTHLLNANSDDTQEPIDLLNAYELARRQDFCKRYTEWCGKPLSVEIHKITRDNAIYAQGVENDHTGNQADTNGTV